MQSMSSKCDRILELYQAGIRQADIAREVGASRQYIRQVIYVAEGRCACGRQPEPAHSQCARCHTKDRRSRRKRRLPARRAHVGLPQEPRPVTVRLRMPEALYNQAVDVADREHIGLDAMLLRAVAAVIDVYNKANPRL